MTFLSDISEYTKHCQSIGLSHSIGDASVSVGVVMNEVDLHWMRSSIDGVLRSAGIGAAPVNVKLDQFVHSMKFSFSQPHVAFDNGQLNRMPIVRKSVAALGRNVLVAIEHQLFHVPVLAD